jgi:aromatic amino acid aminotransferase I
METGKFCVMLETPMRECTKILYVLLPSRVILRWSRVIQTLCDPGEVFLAEEWSYPSALAAAAPLNITPVPVGIDGQGLRSDELRKVLSEWDESLRGAKRPHVLYTIPVGQNPSGSVSRRSIYSYSGTHLRMSRPWGCKGRKRSTTFAWSLVRFNNRVIFCLLMLHLDVIIVEDDPYYFLQMPTYVPKEIRKASNIVAPDPETHIANLVPSFVRFVFTPTA